ncbi:MAG: hypothetical protein JKY98_12495 [Gammaproteobacteria bacterium]|nr:hypothetical protein [Gammaproteobacteria bacterium]
MKKVHVFVESKLNYLSTLSQLLDRDKNNSVIRMSDKHIVQAANGDLRAGDFFNNDQIVELTTEQKAEYMKVFDAFPTYMRHVERHRDGSLFIIIYQKQHNDVKDLAALVYPTNGDIQECSQMILDDYKIFNNGG